MIGLSYAPFYLGKPNMGIVEDAADLHIISSLLVFILLVILMISSYRLSRGLFRFLSLSLGIVALAAFLLGLSGNYLGLGPGGMERFMIFSFDVWAVGFGAHLVSAPGWPSRTRPTAGMAISDAHLSRSWGDREGARAHDAAPSHSSCPAYAYHDDPYESRSVDSRNHIGN